MVSLKNTKVLIWLCGSNLNIRDWLWILNLKLLWENCANSTPGNEILLWNHSICLPGHNALVLQKQKTVTTPLQNVFCWNLCKFVIFDAGTGIRQIYCEKKNNFLGLFCSKIPMVFLLEMITVWIKWDFVFWKTSTVFCPWFLQIDFINDIAVKLMQITLVFRSSAMATPAMLLF